MMRVPWLAVVVFCGCLAVAAAGSGQEPGWYGRVVVPEPERQVIESTPILQRPYRPLHFYGNTVRRRHYRGRAIPTWQDMTQGTALLLQRG